MKRNIWIHVALGLMGVALLLAPLPAAMGGNRAPRATNAKHDQHAVQNANETDGERIFAQNCSRCHHAPEGFSPAISGTIVRHMRVRASLSEKDARALLRFLNP